MRLRHFKFLALAILFLPLAASASENNYAVVIPKVLSYPVTSLAFNDRVVFGFALPVSPSGVRVTFDNPAWSATLSEVHWSTRRGGTYFKFFCEPSSKACLQATGGKGSYTYTLLPSNQAAPAAAGGYQYTWDVAPPGDFACDNVIVTTVPEPGSISLLGLGLIGLWGIARKKIAH